LYSAAGRDVDSLSPEEEEEMYSQALDAVDAQGVSTHTSSLGDSLSVSSTSLHVHTSRRQSNACHPLWPRVVLSSYVVDQNGKVTRALHIHIIRLRRLFPPQPDSAAVVQDELQLNDCLMMLPMDDIAEFDDKKFNQGMAALNKIAEAIKGDAIESIFNDILVAAV